MGKLAVFLSLSVLVAVLVVLDQCSVGEANDYGYGHHDYHCPDHIVHKHKTVKVPYKVVKKIPEVKVIKVPYKVPVKVPVYIPIKEEKHYEHKGYDHKGYDHGYHGGDDHYGKHDEYKHDEYKKA